MKKPKPKATSAPPKPPQTDAEALRDIVLWSADRPAWQRQALRQLAQQDQLSTDQVDALFELSVDAKAASAPLTEADVRSPKSQTATVVLRSVSSPEDVNALASDQTLSFEKSGLTIVYGDNGAGKSGYARILKHACRARLDPKGPPILPNIYSQAAGTPRAKIAYAVNTLNKQINWQLDKPSPPELSAISVFDARTATVHVDATNEVAYIPSSLDLLQRLARTADIIRERARQTKSALEAQTPQSLKAPPVDPETVVAKAVTALSPTTDVQALETGAQLSQQETTALADLKRDLTGDPARAARELGQARAGLARFEGTINTLCQNASASSLEALKTLLASKIATRAAADATAQNRFGTEPLPLVGSDAWRALWEAARRYATTEAQPGKPFPPSATDDHCPLCQQSLSEAAVDRFARFEAFVSADAKRQADDAEQAYQDRLSLIQEALIPMDQLTRSLHYIRDKLSDQPAHDALRKGAIQARFQLRRILRSHADNALQVLDTEPTQASAELSRVATDLRTRETALAADAQSPQRKALVARLHELEARAWSATVLPDIKNEIERKKQNQNLDRVVTEAATNAITQKTSQLAETLITDALRAQFTKEIAALRVGDLAVELKKEPSQSGAARFRVRLIRKPNAPLGVVLSEGEHRCVALAAFLAELATSGSKSAIIFDDPVSSLDHRHRKDVASRLAEEARHRQVIVLTHDVAFLMLLNEAAADVQVHVGYRCVARGAQHAGFCSHELPYNARPIDSVLDAIETNLNNKRILWEKGKQAEWRNAVRAALEQLRETWERAVEEFIGPVFKRLSTKVDTKNLRKLTVLEIADCDAMREGFGACSELLHSVSESLNPKLPAPADLQAEIAKLRDWYQGLRSRQEKIKAA